MPVRNIYAKQTLTVSSVAVPLTVPTTPHARPMGAIVTVETDAIRFWCDGSTPTSTQGHLAPVGTQIELFGEDEVVNFKAIRITTDAVIQVSYGMHDHEIL